jgi:arginyl-tRNA synthetase
MNDELTKFLSKEIDKEINFNSLIEKPKNNSFGDYAVPMFILAKKLSQNPIQIAKEFEEKLSKKLPSFLEKIVATGPFLNFYLNNSKLTKEIIDNIQSKEIFKIKNKDKKTILIEYPSPNTNKAMHIGHVRNILLGNTLSNILKKTGNKVILTNLNNDRGIAICKAMLGYQIFFHEKTPESENMKPDVFVQNAYVKFEAESKKDESLLEQAQQMLVKWEENDTKVRELWDQILNWVYEGYFNTYKNLKLPKFDCEFCESEIYDKGKELVLKALDEKIEGFVREDDNAVACDFKDKTYGKKYLLRGDGTTLYMTQDLYLASIKAKKFKADKYIFIVGREQEYHFEVLFKLLDRMKITKTDNNLHYSYGYVYDKDGNKFSSRNGNTLSADDLLDLVNEKAKQNLLSKELTKNLSDKEMDSRSRIIGYCALSFSILNVNPQSEIKFDLDKALSFEGETGPYVLYTYARIKSILRKANKFDTKIDSSLFNEKENLILKELNEFQTIINNASDKLKPSLITNYLIKISQMFNEYYHSVNILKEENKQILDARLNLISCFAIVLKETLEILNIETLDEM